MKKIIPGNIITLSKVQKIIRIVYNYTIKTINCIFKLKVLRKKEKVQKVIKSELK